MSWQKPSSSELWTAIEIYLKHAYASDPPVAVRTRLESLRASRAPCIYDCDVFERDAPAEPARYSLRLGNQFYPHMKLVIERAPDGQRYLLRADTHDRHICPDPASREYGMFCELMGRNQQVSQTIEASWEEHDLPTFKSYLKQDLARRKAGGE